MTARPSHVLVRHTHAGWVCAAVVATFLASMSTQAAEIAEPFPGPRSLWHGFDRYDFTVDVPGEKQPRGAIVVAPRVPAPGRPWIWWAEFFGHRPSRRSRCWGAAITWSI